MNDDTRPTSFGQALEAASASAVADAPADTSDATAGSSPATTQDPTPHAAAATQPGAGDGTRTETGDEWDPAAGPIPVDRHKAILENTRKRANDAALAALQQEYGWGLQLGPENFRKITDIAKQWASDPVAFVLGALDDLSGHPQYAPTLRSHVARLLATRQGNGHGAAPQDGDAEPQPDIVVDGYAWYSAKQQAARDRWLSNQLLAQMRQELSPLREDLASRQKREEVQAAMEQANNFAATTLAEMYKLPYFKEHKADIEATFRAMPPMPDEQVGQAIRDAYIHVLTTKVLPAIPAAAQSSLLSTLNQKAVASAQPAAAARSAVATRPTSFEQALKDADAAVRR